METRNPGINDAAPRLAEPPLATRVQPLDYYEARDSWRPVVRAVGATAIAMGLIGVLNMLWPLRYAFALPFSVTVLFVILGELAHFVASGFLLIAGFRVAAASPRGRRLFLASAWSVMVVWALLSLIWIVQNFLRSSSPYSANLSVRLLLQTALSLLRALEIDLLPLLMIYLLTRPAARALFAA